MPVLVAVGQTPSIGEVSVGEVSWVAYVSSDCVDLLWVDFRESAADVGHLETQKFGVGAVLVQHVYLLDGVRS